MHDLRDAPAAEETQSRDARRHRQEQAQEEVGEAIAIVRLATTGSDIERVALAKQYEPVAPALLISYAYLWQVDRYWEDWQFRDYAMDSGAFTAWTSGKEIDIDDYIAHVKKTRETDPKLTEVFGLDVIGDAEASIANVEYMYEQGVPCIPTFHLGSDFKYLKHIAAKYPKIALGGLAGKATPGERQKWCSTCFGIVWPKLIHGFGIAGEAILSKLPFDSVDASTWATSPTRFARYNSFGRRPLRTPSKWRPPVQVEVEWFLSLERSTESRWKKTLAPLRENQSQ